MLAATAASRWGGWREVTRLLDGQVWLDSAYDARGRRLLTRAALEQGADSAALTNALAIPVSSIDTVEGDRLVLLATALDRLRARDSAASTYARAALRLPAVAGWLRIRAAGVTDDSARRAALYARIDDPLVRERIVWTEAVAHRGTGDLRSAAARYQALGARATALRLRLAMSPDSANRAGVRRDLTALVAARRSPGEVRDAVSLLDSAFASPDAGRTARGRTRGGKRGQPFPRGPGVRGGVRGRSREGRGSLRLRDDADPARTPCRRRAAVHAGARPPRPRRDGRLSARPCPGPLGRRGPGRCGARAGAPRLSARHHGRQLRALPAGRPRFRRSGRRPGPRLLPADCHSAIRAATSRPPPPSAPR